MPGAVARLKRKAFINRRSITMRMENVENKLEEPLRGVPALPQAGDLVGRLVRPVAVASFDDSAAVLAPAPTPLALLIALRRRYKLALGLGLILGGIVAAGVWL